MSALLTLVQTDPSLMVLQYNKTAAFVFVSPSLIKQTVIIISPLSASVFFFPSVVSFGRVVDHKGADFLDVKTLQSRKGNMQQAEDGRSSLLLRNRDDL